MSMYANNITTWNNITWKIPGKERYLGYGVGLYLLDDPNDSSSHRSFVPHIPVLRRSYLTKPGMLWTKEAKKIFEVEFIPGNPCDPINNYWLVNVLASLIDSRVFLEARPLINGYSADQITSAYHLAAVSIFLEGIDG